jgi:hypothetical protein
MFEEIAEILNRASQYDFRLLPLYDECQSVADETQRLLWGNLHKKDGGDPGCAAGTRHHDAQPGSAAVFRDAA